MISLLKLGDPMSLVSFTEKDINFILTDMNQILTEIEDDPTHSISLYQN
jgi:hypothetical protein